MSDSSGSGLMINSPRHHTVISSMFLPATTNITIPENGVYTVNMTFMETNNKVVQKMLDASKEDDFMENLKNA